MAEGKRIWWYLGIAFSIPLLSIIISLAKSLIPDVPNSFFKPQYGRNTCFFDCEYFFCYFKLYLKNALIWVCSKKFKKAVLSTLLTCPIRQ